MFRKILEGLKALLEGHFTVLKHVFRKRITLEYPEKKSALNERFRGKLHVDTNKCIACLMCQKVCPAFGTIEIEREQKEGQKPVLKTFTIDTAQCIYCSNCVNTCPVNALYMTDEYELATYTLEELKSYNKKNGEGES